MSLDLSFGNSICIRKALLDTYRGHHIVFDRKILENFDYGNHLGDPELVETTRKIIKRQINKEYKHVFIVNGATGGCVIAMRAFEKRSVVNCLTRNAPYYTRYPSMIKAAGLDHIDERFHQIENETVALIDVPSNPLGLMNNVANLNIPVILDGVYLNRVYMNPNQISTIPHDVYVGSYSKLLGINGSRLGYLCTDDDLLAERIKELIVAEYCSLSVASQEIVKSITHKLDWEKFENSARWSLDLNREEWSKLYRYFDGKSILPVGMFHVSQMDQKAQDLFTKVGIIWTKGSLMGVSDEFARFNLGQSNDIIRLAVKKVLDADRIRITDSRKIKALSPSLQDKRRKK